MFCLDNNSKWLGERIKRKGKNIHILMIENREKKIDINININSDINSNGDKNAKYIQ